MDQSEVIKTLFYSFDNFTSALLSCIVDVLVNCFFVGREEGSNCFVVNDVAGWGKGVEQDEGEDYAEGHVSELVEEELQEGNADFCD